MSYLFHRYNLALMGYCALTNQAYEVKENMIFYSEVNVHRKAYKHLKYKRLVLTKLINFY